MAAKIDNISETSKEKDKNMKTSSTKEVFSISTSHTPMAALKRR